MAWSSLLTLSNQAIEVLIVRTLQAQVAATDIVDGLIVDHEAAVGVLESSVSGQDGVVWLDHSSGDLRGRIDTEFELALFTIVDRETLHQQCTEAGASTTTEGVEDEETLKTGAVVCNAADLVEHLVDELLADSVVASSIVVGSIFFASDHVLRVEETTIGAGADLIDDVGLKIAVDGTRDIFALTCSSN